VFLVATKSFFTLFHFFEGGSALFLVSPFDSQLFVAGFCGPLPTFGSSNVIPSCVTPQNWHF